MIKNIKKNIILVVLLSFFFVSVFTTITYGAGISKYEYHHIYPRAIFNDLGDDSVIKLREFEHKWVHYNKGSIFLTDASRYKKGFDGDWENKVNADKVFGDSKFRNWLITGDYNKSKTAYGSRKVALIIGSRILSYRILLRDYNNKEITRLLAMELDGVGNFIYNLSYIMSIPSNSVSFFRFALSNPNIYQEGFLINNFTRLYLIAWGIIQLIIGFFMSLIMLIIGSIIGFVFHPLQTIANLTVSFSDPLTTNIIATSWDILMAIIKPIVNLLFWTF